MTELLTVAISGGGSSVKVAGGGLRDAGDMLFLS